MKFRTRLTIVFISLIGFSMLAAGIFVAKMLKDSHIEALEDHMQRELRVISATVDWPKSGTESDLMKYYTIQTQNLKQYANARVTYIRADGKVMGDSDTDPSQMDNHLNRPEIKNASSNAVGFSIRMSTSVKHEMLYAAIPLKEGDTTIGYIRLALSLAEAEAYIERSWFVLGIGLLVLFVIAGLVSFRIAHSITRPIDKITRVAKQITNFNYKSRAVVRSNDEIGQLGTAINRMADSLQMQLQRILENETRLKSVLEHMPSGLLMIDKEGRIALLNRSAEDILGFTAGELLGKNYEDAKQQFEFTQLIQECIDTRESLRDEMIFYYPQERILEISLSPIAHADEEWTGVLIVLHDITAVRRLEGIRSEFVANVSHELKTPIAAVKGFAETLLAGAMKDPEITKSFLQIIFDESERLNRLIGDILELSKVESKRIPLHYSPVHMNSFITKTLNMMQTEADKKQIQLDMYVEEDLYMEADEDRLGQILINLLSNGINYTPEGGSVKVKAVMIQGTEDEDDKVEITISDTGIGIPKKDLPRIFERFYRVDKARSRSSGGTGLGLSIVKHLVELHHGTIRVESDVSIGTRFIIQMPVIHEL